MKNSILAVLTALFTMTIIVICAESHKILVGVCNSPKTAKEAGFDYVEMGASSIAKMSDADFEKLLQTVKETGIPVRTCNGFLPGTIKVTGPVINKTEQEEYVKKCFDRLNKLGVKFLVFGSGGARALPENFPREKGFEQIVDFCKRIGPLAREKDIMIVIEPLNSKECNFVNSGKEGLDIIEAVKDPNIELLLDLYHMAKDNESPDIVLKAGAHVKHVHIANPNGRKYPLAADEYDYKTFFDNLKKIGYTGGVSVEGGTKDFKNDGPKAAAFLKEQLQK